MNDVDELRQRMDRLADVAHICLRPLHERAVAVDGRLEVDERETLLRENEDVAHGRVAVVADVLAGERDVFEQHAAVEQDRQRLQKHRRNELAVEECRDVVDQRVAQLRLRGSDRSHLPSVSGNTRGSA